MGLDKTKRILTENDFNKDPLASQNLLLKQKSSQSLPILSSDVMLDKNQEVFFSAQYVLKNLIQNDKFIEEYFKKTQNKLSKISSNKLVQAFGYNGEGKAYPTEDDTSIYRDFLSDHIKKFHKPPATSLSVIERDYMDADCLNIDFEGARLHGFQKFYPRMKTSDEGFSQSISNDFVIKTEFDDSPDVRKATNYIAVSIANNATNNTFQTDLNLMTNQIKNLPSLKESKYIYKEWLSGMKELYIYLPTTFTFYNENPSEDLREKTTFIQVKINNRHFPINRIYFTQICGQSLPLLIHMDDFNYFNDVIQPSIVRSTGMSDTEKENVKYSYDIVHNSTNLYFCCYGTDAQAIRLIYD